MNRDGYGQAGGTETHADEVVLGALIAGPEIGRPVLAVLQPDGLRL